MGKNRGSNGRAKQELRQKTSHYTIAHKVKRTPSDKICTGLEFGVVVYDLEALHDAPCGTYAEKKIFECTPEQEKEWKSRCQIIQFAAIDVGTGRCLQVSCRPEFAWSEVKSKAMRMFAMDHGLDKLVSDESLPMGFRHSWENSVLPFLREVSGRSRRLALIAHNGDKLDHPVLQKELIRLGVPELPFKAHWFDTVRSLKRTYGESYGQHGGLVLRQLFEPYAASSSSQALQPSHCALSDCRTLLEVLAHREDLRELLANEIVAKVLEVDMHSNVLNACFRKAPSLSMLRVEAPEEVVQLVEQKHVKIPMLAFKCRCPPELEGALLGPSIGKRKGLDIARRFGVHVLKVVESDAVEWRNCPKRYDALHRGWTYFIVPGEVKARVLDPHDLTGLFAPWYAVPGTNGEVRLNSELDVDGRVHLRREGRAFEEFLKTLSPAGVKHQGLWEADLRSKCLDVFDVEMPKGAPPCWIGAPALEALLFVAVELILDYADVPTGSHLRRRVRAIPQGRVIFTALCQCLQAQCPELHKVLRVRLPDSTVRELGQMQALNMRYTFGWSPAAVHKQDGEMDIPATAYTVVHEGDKLLFLYPDNPMAKGKQEVPKTYLDKIKKLQSLSFLKQELQPVLPRSLSLTYGSSTSAGPSL